MDMKILITLLVIAMMPLCAKADVFKCKISDSKTVYQPTPCEHAAAVQKVDIQKRSQEKDAEAAAKLRAWNKKREAQEALEYERNKELAERSLREKEVDAQLQNADEQRKQSEALARQASALEEQNHQSFAQPPMKIINHDF
jgi:hypothetical protein